MVLAIVILDSRGLIVRSNHARLSALSTELAATVLVFAELVGVGKIVQYEPVPTIALDMACAKILLAIVTLGSVLTIAQVCNAQMSAQIKVLATMGPATAKALFVVPTALFALAQMIALTRAFAMMVYAIATPGSKGLTAQKKFAPTRVRDTVCARRTVSLALVMLGGRDTTVR